MGPLISLAGPYSVHLNGINVIILGAMNGETVGISEGVDSAIILWRPDGTLLSRIELGAWVLAIRPLSEHRIVVGTDKGTVAIDFSSVVFDVT